MSTLIHHRVELCRQGKNPKTVCRVASGWVVLGDVQFLPGYCLILPDPVVPDLNALDAGSRSTFLFEASLVGDALLAVTDAYRINYEVLGNSEPALHVHIFPRYASEPEQLRRMPAWFYDWDNAQTFDAARDQALIADLRAYLMDVGLAG
jgi:diadenosine tetraphosphate (Ap4A) HIT family hydrolase